VVCMEESWMCVFAIHAESESRTVPVSLQCKPQFVVCRSPILMDKSRTAICLLQMEYCCRRGQTALGAKRLRPQE